ncbi:MAG: chromosome segregation SMC family protein, partial [Acidobacteriota bacterium]
MRLERVDILGFKSFPERTELSFHEGVTAIVGPNGCGKSNVSDAIGWVLGEQSAKSLRGQKMEDLIFSGSESRDSLGVAEVNLCLSQVNGDSPGERRHVVVTRRLYRSGESEYLMDGSPCRLRDIQDLFMDTGIGAKAYAIIEQGKIGLVLSSKPSDRRGLIEEAAGITKYRARRRSAELKLQAAQQNLYRVNDIVYEIERQINSLKRQASKARRYRRLRDSMSHLQKIVAVKTNRERGERVRLVRRELKTLTDRELQRTTGVVTAESYLERLRLEQAEREGALSDARERLHQLELTVERLDNQIVRDGQQAGELARRRGRLDTELEELGRRLGPSSRQLEARRADEQAVTAELSRLEEKALLTSGQLSQASAALATTEQEIEAARSELVHRISKIAALKNFLQGV